MVRQTADIVQPELGVEVEVAFFFSRVPAHSVIRIGQSFDGHSAEVKVCRLLRLTSYRLHVIPQQVVKGLRFVVKTDHQIR